MDCGKAATYAMLLTHQEFLQYTVVVKNAAQWHSKSINRRLTVHWWQRCSCLVRASLRRDACRSPSAHCDYWKRRKGKKKTADQFYNTLHIQLFLKMMNEYDAYYPENIFSKNTSCTEFWKLNLQNRDQLRLSLYWLSRHGNAELIWDRCTIWKSY